MEETSKEVLRAVVPPLAHPEHTLGPTLQNRSIELTHRLGNKMTSQSTSLETVTCCAAHLCEVHIVSVPQRTPTQRAASLPGLVELQECSLKDGRHLLPVMEVVQPVPLVVEVTLVGGGRGV